MHEGANVAAHASGFALFASSTPARRAAMKVSRHNHHALAHPTLLDGIFSKSISIIRGAVARLPRQSVLPTPAA
ncbi:MAG TPA: hypothetical protein VF534_32005 [Paraburkholderia sp.]